MLVNNRFQSKGVCEVSFDRKDLNGRVKFFTIPSHEYLRVIMNLVIMCNNLKF